MKSSFNHSHFILVIGLGVAGLSCLRYLAKQGLRVAVNDSRSNPPALAVAQHEFPAVQIVTGEFSQALFEQADEIVVSPGIALTHPLLLAARARGVPIIGDIELFARVVRAPIVAITGSNGKSTVTTLVGLMAQQAGLNVKVGGNLGTPVLDFLNEAEAECYVLELSSFQLDTTYSLKTKTAVVLNVSPDHMDRYASIADYLHSKQHIYNGCEQAIVNLDEASTWQNLSFDRALSGFSIDSSWPSFPLKKIFAVLQESNEIFLSIDHEKVLPISAMKLKGKHNWQNALAALALGSAMNLPIAAMLQVLRDFPGLPHRCEWVARINEVDWINDSKGTNVGATQSALKGFGELLAPNKIILIAGGQGKDADFTLLNPELRAYVKHVILMGEDAPLLVVTWKSIAKLSRADSLAHAVDKAAALAESGDLVLLSPACASLDMFKNYEDRGEQFVKLVNKLL